MVSKIDLGILALGALAVVLVIRGAGQKLDNLTNPLSGVTLPSLPSLPSIGNLPSLDSIFGGIPSIGSEQTPVIRENTSSFIGATTEPRGLDVQPEGSRVVIDENNTRFIGGSEILDPLGQVVSPDRPLSLGQFSNVQSPEENEEVRAMQQVQSAIQGQQFQGGGQGFIGGQVTETPIANLSLGQIIERFNVTASQASDLRARARDDFGNLDFGSNTGSGIGGILNENPEISSMLPSDGAVSNPEFEGLSAQEIVNQLTGGNISNF